MSEEAKETRRTLWLGIGIFLTVVVLGLGAYLASRSNCYWQGPSPVGCISNFQYFLNSPPNEIGDTLAGFAGALAFIWLFVAVMLQSQELGHALDEYKEMAKAMKVQSEQLKGQTKLLLAKSADEDQEAILLSLHKMFVSLDSKTSKYFLFPTGPQLEGKPQYLFPIASQDTLDQYFIRLNKNYATSKDGPNETKLILQIATSSWGKSLQSLRYTGICKLLLKKNISCRWLVKCD